MDRISGKKGSLQSCAGKKLTLRTEEPGGHQARKRGVPQGCVLRKTRAVNKVIYLSVPTISSSCSLNSFTNLIDQADRRVHRRSLGKQPHPRDLMSSGARISN